MGVDIKLNISIISLCVTNTGYICSLNPNRKMYKQILENISRSLRGQAEALAQNPNYTKQRLRLNTITTPHSNPRISEE